MSEKRSTTSLAACTKKWLSYMGCIFFALTASMFAFAPFDPGDMSISAGWALAAVSGWLVKTLYQVAEKAE